MSKGFVHVLVRSGAVLARLGLASALALALALAACGGGDSAPQPQAPQPPTPPNGVAIAEGSGIVAASLGDEQQQIFALPGEVTQRTLRVQRNDRSLLLDIAVTRGAEAVSVREEAGRLLVTVNSTTLRAGDAIPYTVTVRNRLTGTGAEVNGTVQVLPPTTVASGQVTEAGGVIENQAAKVRIEFDPKPGAVPLNVAVNVVDQSDGRRQIRIVFDRDISSDDRVIRIAPPSSFANTAQAKILSTGRKRIAGVSTLPLLVPYQGYFTLDGGFRFEAGLLRLAAMAVSCSITPVGAVLYVCYEDRPDAAELRGSYQSAGEPVLFVHGYQVGDSLGGGNDTWGEFFSLVQRLNATPFEFQWRTNARFQTVADDLARAILAIRANSGDRKITVVAHSFGGVLVRSLLQHLGTDKSTDWSQHIRQVVTLGAPHSGIFDSTTQSQSGLFTFPNGQDSWLFERCDQISCHQMGEKVFSRLPASLQLVALTGVNSAPGEVAAMLANLDANALPRAVPFSVGIGLAMEVRLSLLNNIVGTMYRNGDALISLQGQRFTPRLLGSTGDWTGDLAYLRCATVFGPSGPHVEEIVLGSDGRFPGQSFDLPVIQKGYGHDNWSLLSVSANRSANLHEANVACTTTSCPHPSFQLVKRALENGVCYPTITRGPETVFTSNGTALFTVTASGNPPLTYQWRINGADLVVDGNGRSTQCGTGFLAAGISTATLSLTGLPTGCSSTNFTVVVGSGPLLTTSALATLFVAAPPTPPTVTDQPRDALAVNGGAASFSVIAMPTGLFSLSYQWRLGALALRDDQSIDCGGSIGGTGVVVSGATSRALTLSNLPLSCNGERFFVEVTNGPAGGAGLTVASRAAMLTVASTALPPAISGTGQPQNTTVTAGQTANFTVVASGTGPLTYQWRRNGVNVACAAGANCPTYTTPATTTGDNGAAYSVVVSNSVNSITSSAATLTVTSTTGAPTISAAGQPQSVTVIVGQTATFVVTATGTGLSYQWRKNGANVTCTTGTNCPSYTTPATTAADDGAIYSVVVSNTAGSVTSSNATLTVSGRPVVPPKAVDLAAGSHFTCALTAAGGVKCWGRNLDYQLGDGTRTDRLTPVGVLGLSSGVVAIAPGGGHTCALMTTGSVKCWGYSRWGQAGRFVEMVTQPTEVLTLGSDVASVAPNWNHTCALTTLGSAKCWGLNLEGQVGDGTFADRSTPTNVFGLGSGVIALARGGSNTSCAVTIGGGVKCWGNNASGELGDGTLSNRNVPVDVLGLSTGVTEVTTGNGHACAVTTAGSVKCWGRNEVGQLGNGTGTGSATPTDVVGLSGGVTTVTTSSQHTCALTSAGGVKCWGDNYGGQLGDGTLVNRSAPVDVVGLSSGVKSIATGAGHSCARMIAGNLKCWGRNYLGALGDGTLTDRLTPVDVVGF